MTDRTDNQRNAQLGSERENARSDSQAQRGNGHSSNDQSRNDNRSHERSNTAARQSNERSVGTLLRDLMLEVTSLVRNEAELAKAEVSQKVSSVQTGATSMVVAVVVLLVGLIGLMHAAINGLTLIWPSWMAALVVGGVIVIVGLIALAVGRSKLRAANLNTPRVSREMGKDRAFVQEQTR